MNAMKVKKKMTVKFSNGVIDFKKNPMYILFGVSGKNEKMQCNLFLMCGCQVINRFVIDNQNLETIWSVIDELSNNEFSINLVKQEAIFLTRISVINGFPLYSEIFCKGVTVFSPPIPFKELIYYSLSTLFYRLFSVNSPFSRLILPADSTQMLFLVTNSYIIQ